MWRDKIPDHRAQDSLENQLKGFKELLRYIAHAANQKLGYLVSLLTYLSIVNNDELRIKSGSLAHVLLNNVRGLFKDSETSLMEVKPHKGKLISILD